MLVSAIFQTLLIFFLVRLYLWLWNILLLIVVTDEPRFESHSLPVHITVTSSSHIPSPYQQKKRNKTPKIYFLRDFIFGCLQASRRVNHFLIPFSRVDMVAFFFFFRFKRWVDVLIEHQCFIIMFIERTFSED